MCMYYVNTVHLSLTQAFIAGCDSTFLAKTFTVGTYPVGIPPPIKPCLLISFIYCETPSLTIAFI